MRPARQNISSLGARASRRPVLKRQVLWARGLRSQEGRRTFSATCLGRHFGLAMVRPTGTVAHFLANSTVPLKAAISYYGAS